MKNFREVAPGKKSLKKDYVAIMMWFMGRAIQAAAAVDRAVKKEFAGMPDRFTFALSVMPNGPHMIIGKDRRGVVRYRGWDPEGKKIDLDMKIKNIEAAMLIFTFRRVPPLPQRGTVWLSTVKWHTHVQSFASSMLLRFISSRRSSQS